MRALWSLRGREKISFLGFTFGQGVGFEVATFGRSDGQGLRIVVEAEAQIEARIEEFLLSRWILFHTRLIARFRLVPEAQKLLFLFRYIAVR